MTNQRLSGAAGQSTLGEVGSRSPEPRNTQHVNKGETGRDGPGCSCRNDVKSPAPPTRVGTIFLLAGATANACSDLPLMLARLADVEVRQETVPPEDGGSQARYGDWSSPGPDEGQQRTGWRGHPGISAGGAYTSGRRTGFGLCRVGSIPIHWPIYVGGGVTRPGLHAPDRKGTDSRQCRHPISSPPVEQGGLPAPFPAHRGGSVRRAFSEVT